MIRGHRQRLAIALCAIVLCTLRPASAQSGPGDAGIFTTTLRNGLKSSSSRTTQRRSFKPRSGTASDRCRRRPGRPASRTRSST